jgi:hypothetical protein
MKKWPFYFLLFCILIGISIPVFLLNPVKAGKIPYDISIKDLTNGNTNEKDSTQQSTRQQTNNPVSTYPGNSQNNSSTNSTQNGQIPTTQSIPINEELSKNSNTQLYIPSNSNLQNSYNAVTYCGNDFDAVNIRISPSIDYTTRDRNNYDSQVLYVANCNTPIYVDYSRVINNSDGKWYPVLFDGKRGWINAVCIKPY